MGSSVSRSLCLSESQLNELYEIGIPRGFYSKQELNSWYRSFLKACDVQGQQQLSRERFHELMRKYAKSQCKEVGKFLDKFSDQLFDGLAFPKRINARIVKKQDGVKCLTRDRIPSNESDIESMNEEITDSQSIQGESQDKPDWGLKPPRVLCSAMSSDGRPNYITFTQFMAVMTQIKDELLSKRWKNCACKDLQTEWMFKMIAGPDAWRMKEDNWVNIHRWVRRMEGEKFGQQQDLIVRKEFAKMHTNQYEDVGLSDFREYLDTRK
jgi:hypothetical protein